MDDFIDELLEGGAGDDAGNDTDNDARSDDARSDDARSDNTGNDASDEPVDLHALLASFVALYAGVRQRDAGWYESMSVTVGGSEIAALMGLNPYTKFHDVVASKIAKLRGQDTWTGGGEACWWGVLFEDVIAAYVAVDLGAPVLGDEICIQEFPGHRNSPDGYIVVRTYLGADGERHLWTTDMSPRIPTREHIAMLEFKCPVSRRPTGAVPGHYRPQLWSGLAVSPVAAEGLFVDAVFRKCALDDLGPSAAYDTAYHARDARAAPWLGAVAWGLIGVYAPRLDAPRWVRMGWRGEEWGPGDPPAEGADADAAQAAWAIHASLTGGAAGADLGAAAAVADLGGASEKVFNRALRLIDARRFPVVRLEPCLVGGRGREADDVEGDIAGLAARAPPHHALFAVIPWKLMEVHYAPVARRPGFLEEIRPLIEQVHRLAAEAMGSPDPDAFFRQELQRSQGPPSPSQAALIQELFDTL